MSWNLRVLGSSWSCVQDASPRAVEGAAKVGLPGFQPTSGSYLQSGILLTGPVEKRRVVAPWGKVSWELRVACFLPAWCQGNRIGCKSLKRSRPASPTGVGGCRLGMCQTRLWDLLQMGNDSGVGEPGARLGQLANQLSCVC